MFVAARRRQLAATLSGTAHLVAQPPEAPDNLAIVDINRRLAYGAALGVGSLLAAEIGW